MSSVVLLSEQLVRECGEGLPVLLDGIHEGPIRLTLDITRILQDENLDVAIFGSLDGVHWQRIASFPHKSYCGTYAVVLDPEQHSGIRYLKTCWSVDRWQPGAGDPIFSFSVFAEDLTSRAATVH
ncbi:MAG: hypothetical protein ABL995_16690 [Bryobacteraceae bacterium]